VGDAVLVVLAIALLAVGVATLGVGLFSNSLGWVFVSVGATALALLPLFVMYRRGRHVGWLELHGETMTPDSEDPTDWRSALSRRLGSESGPEVGPGRESGPGRELGSESGPEVGPGRESGPGREVAEGPIGSVGGEAGPGGGVPPPVGPGGSAGGAPAPSPVGLGDAPWRPEPSSPLAGYDELRVAEILPLLTRLDATTLGEIRQREVSGRARPTILARIDELEAFVSGPGPGSKSSPSGG